MISKIINVAIVEEHTLFRKTLKNYLLAHHEINVIAQSDDIPGLLAALKDVHADVLVMDIFLPNVNGLETVKIIKERYSEIKVLILSMCTDMELLCNLLDAGVYGIVSKTDEPEELIRAILSVSENKIYRSRLFTEVLYWNKQVNIKRDSVSGHITLSEREKEILQLLWDEKSNKEIASQLFLSIRSIEKIKQDMKEKLEVKSTIGLLKCAIDKQIININARLPIKDPRSVKNVLS